MLTALLMLSNHIVAASDGVKIQQLEGRQTIFVLANLVIVAGYLFVATRVVTLLPVRTLTRVGAIAFFVFCALTHGDQALHTLISQDETWGTISGEWHMTLIHVPQAFSVWIFVVGLYSDLRDLRAERGTSGAAIQS